MWICEFFPWLLPASLVAIIFIFPVLSTHVFFFPMPLFFAQTFFSKKFDGGGKN
ncbi:hypothetical protein C5S39_01865 [Candidatus Methanophagaceae archaeon]|nr:hypothetical protein C5S39_01865 [Methanophagales archaeon]